MALSIYHSKTLGSTKDSTEFDINSPEWNGAHVISGNLGLSALSIGGNTSGTPADVNSGRVVIAGGNNITLSQEGQTISIIGASVGTGTGASQSVQTQNMVSINNSTGPISIVAGSNISLSESLSVITINGRTDILTTAMQSDAGSNFIYASASKNLTNISATLASNAISFSIGNYITTAMQSDQGSNFMNVTERSNLIYSSAGKNLTNISVTLGSNSISLSVGNYITTGAQSNAVVLTNAGLNLTNISATLASNSISLSVGNYITTGAQSNAVVLTNAGLNLTNISATLASNSLSLSVGNYITTARGSTDAIGLNSALTANGVSMTANSSGLSLNIPAFLTTAMQSGNGSVFIYSSAGKNLTNISCTLGSNSISLSVGNYITTGMQSDAGSNFIYSSAGKNLTNISCTLASNSISLSVGNYITTAMASNANTSFVNASATTFGSNISVTIASNGLTLSCNDPSAAAEANWHFISGNTSGQTTFSGSTIVLEGGNNITLSGANASKIIISAGAGGGAAYTLLTYQNRQFGASSTISHGQNSLWLTPFRLVAPLSASSMQILLSYSGTITSAATAQHGQTWDFALMSQNAVSTTRFDTYWSGQLTISAWNSGTSSVRINYNGTSSSSAGSNLMTANFMGVRMIGLPINSTLTTGLYIMAIRHSSSTAGYSAHMSRIAEIFDNPVSVGMGTFNQATATSIGFQDGGVFSVTTGAMPVSIGLSEIRPFNNVMEWFKIGAL